jgi:hypothetical protein
MATAIDPKVAPAEKHPDATGREVRDYLKSQGTGASRIELFDSWLQKSPDMSGQQLLEQMIADGVQVGTCMRAGRFLHGATFSLSQGGPSASLEEMDQLRTQNAEMERHVRTLEGRLAFQGNELVNLRKEKQRLTDDLAEKEQQLLGARTEIARLSDGARGETEQPTGKKSGK